MQQKHVLENGLTVLLNPNSNFKSVSVGVYVKSGSADEPIDKHGIAHFVEHMLFKGTNTRTSKQISLEIEGKGGFINAYTDKFVTCYYTTVINTEVDTAIDILSDMYQNSVFDVAEIELEKQVVLEEIDSYNDDENDILSSMLMKNTWRGNALERNIIGKKSTVLALTKEDLVNYANQNHTGPNTIISIAGNFNAKRVLKKIKSCFSQLPKTIKNNQREIPEYSFQNDVRERDVQQASFCIGYKGVPENSDDIYTLRVLNTVFGGKSHSRLFQKIREQMGLAYSIESYVLTYNTCGMFIVYGATNIKNLDRVVSLVLSEINDIGLNGLAEDELTAAKEAIVGNMLLSQEKTGVISDTAAIHEINLGREITINESIDKINQVTNQDIINFVKNNCAPKQYSLVTIRPKNGIIKRILSRLEFLKHNKEEK
jgi:predicted Zn-dependent peptidase